jgi:hypothetical protein
MDIVIFEIDLGKNSCSLAGMDALGRVVLRRRMRRSSMEACCGGKPRLVPALKGQCAYVDRRRVHGKTPIPGDKTHKRRRRLTKSWWNDVWRDRLLAAMHFLAGSHSSIIIEARKRSV